MTWFDYNIVHVHVFSNREVALRALSTTYLWLLRFQSARILIMNEHHLSESYTERTL